MFTWTQVYNGIFTNLKPGSLAVKQGESFQHLATAHVGWGGHWTEVGVVRWVDPPNTWNIFSFDDDEGGWTIHGTTSENTWNTYQIFVSTTHEAAGYLYGIWINGAFARTGHVPNYDNEVNQCIEVWSNNGVWTNDTNSACYDQPKLYTNETQWVWWDNTIGANHWADPPVRHNLYMLGPAYRFIAWVQN